MNKNNQRMYKMYPKAKDYIAKYTDTFYVPERIAILNGCVKKIVIQAYFGLSFLYSLGPFMEGLNKKK